MRNSTQSVEVLVTDGNRRPALATVRSLARHGVSFVVIGEERRSLAFSSRYATHTAVCPSPISAPDAFFDFVLATVKQCGIRLVMPVLEESLLILDGRRSELEPFARLAAADSDALHAVMDKRRNRTIALELGIDCPVQHELDSIDRLPGLVESLGLPIVLKPPGSRYDPRLPSFPFKVLYANDETQLRAYLERYCAAGDYPMFQEYVRGEARNLCCFASGGELVAAHEYVSHRTLKGQGVMREVVETTPDAVHAARRMLRYLKWDGLAQLSFFLDPSNGRLCYLETNGRMWSSIAGSMYAGWDFPYWVYRYFSCGESPVPPPLRIGSRTCWHRGDLVALVNYLAGGEAPDRQHSAGRMRAIRDYVSGFSPSIFADAFARRDPLPEIVDHWQLLGRGLATLSRGLRNDVERLSSPSP